METLNANPAPTLADSVNTTHTDKPVVTETPKEEPLSARFAALARKQKQIQQEKERLKQERTTVDSDRAEYLKWKQEQEAAKSAPAKKLTPIEALQAAGYSYEDAAAFVMNDNKIAPETKIKEVESRIDQMIREQKEKEEAKAKSEEEAQLKAQEKAIADFKTSISDFVTQNAETYELVNLHEAQELIFDTINTHYEQTLAEGAPKILSTKEAADMVEAYLEERVQKSIETKKLQAKLKPAQDDTKGASNPNLSFTSKTLSSSSTSSAGPSAKPGGYKSDEERIQRALALLG